MRERRPTTIRVRGAMAGALALVTLGACAPSTDTCRSVLPPAVGNVRVVQADGRTGCAGEAGEVTVAVEMRRSGLSWQPGAVTVDGRPSSAATLDADIARAQVARKAEKAIGNAVGAIEGIARGVEHAVKPPGK